MTKKFKMPKKLNFINPKRSTKQLFLMSVVIIYVLSYTGMLAPVQTVLESITFSVGSIQDLTLFSIIKRGCTLVLLLWATTYITEKGFLGIDKLPGIKASNRAIIKKVFQSLCYFVAFLISLNVLNIDISHFAIFSGAIGIGIGFGLQKITSNFISGLILSLEKTVEPGHLIELADGSYGLVKSTNARYTLIKAFDGKEIMIPNEVFISQKVTNWTYSGQQARLDFTVGVSYESDIEKAKSILLEVMSSHPKCSDYKAPGCYLKEFGDNAIQLFCMFWVDDITQGRLSVKSEIQFEVLRRFKQDNIDIAYPQHVVHLRTATPQNMQSQTPHPQALETAFLES